MKTSINLIKRMARLGILPTEPVKYKHEDDIIIKKEEQDQRVVLDDVTDEDLPLLIALKQYETVNSIKSMVKFFVIFTLVCFGSYLLVFLLELGSHV